MKNLNKFLPVLALAALAAVALVRADEPPATTAPATPPAGENGPRPAPAQMAERRLHFLTEKLSLTAAQQTQIKAIWANDAVQLKALRAETGLSRDDMRAKRMAIMTASHTQVRAVLTPAQQQIFDALPPEPRGHRGPPPGDKPADAPPPQQ
jgi:Spy/CpxP family protein refolding chaperone